MSLFQRKSQFACFAVLLLSISACKDNDDDNTSAQTQNHIPMALNSSVSTQADTVVSGHLMGSDADNDVLHYALVTAPTLGQINLQSDGSYTYTPNANITGEDQFTFTVSDGQSTSAAAQVNITIDLLEVTMGDYTRMAFLQEENAVPLPFESRSVEQDVTDEMAFDDLLEP